MGGTDVASWAPAIALKPQDTISRVQFGPSDLLALTSWDGSIQVANVKGDWSAKWQTSRPQFGLCWSCTESKLFVGGAENRLGMLDCASNQKVDLSVTPAPVTSIADAAGTLVIGTTQGLLLYDTRAGNLASATPFSGNSSAGTSAAVVSVAADRCGAKVVSADSAGICRVWDSRRLDSALSERVPLSGDAQLCDAQFGPDGRLYAVSNAESHVAIEYIDNPAESFVYKTNRVMVPAGAPRLFPVYALAFCEQGLASAGGDKGVYIWDIKRKKLRRQMVFSMACLSISYSRSGQYCALGLSSDEWRATPEKFNALSHAKVLICEVD